VRFPAAPTLEAALPDPSPPVGSLEGRHGGPLILIAGVLKYPPGALETLKDEMRKVVEATRTEDGCINYDFAVDVSDPTRLIIFERWRDRKALESHLGSQHVSEWRTAAAAVGPLERDLSVWEVDRGRPL
jgi:quinol monooxygenase YgiN